MSARRTVVCKPRSSRIQSRCPSANRCFFRLQKKKSKPIETHEEGNTLILSAKDSRAFIDSIENPPAPNEKLRNAMKLYKESVLSAEDRIAEEGA